MSFTFNTCFVKQQGCETRNFARVHIIHHVVESIHTMHVHMAKAEVPKLEHIISR